MKTKIFVLSLILMSFFASKSFSQITTPETKFIYCQILGTQKFMSAKVTVEVDFGQASRLFSDKRLRDDSGNPIVFNSMVDAMNWMGTQGWELAQAYVVSVQGQNVYHWLLKCDISSMNEADRDALLETLKTKKDFK